jgi:hypothetical protein
MQCSKCNSENTQRLEVVYEGGTQTISTTSHSAGAGIGGTLGIGGVRTTTNGTSQSTLASKASPPAKQKFSWSIILALIGFFVFTEKGIGMKLFGILLMGAGGYFTYIAIQFNSQKWPSLYQHWKESWLCNKCGNIYHQP